MISGDELQNIVFPNLLVTARHRQSSLGSKRFLFHQLRQMPYSYKHNIRNPSKTILQIQNIFPQKYKFKKKEKKKNNLFVLSNIRGNENASKIKVSKPYTVLNAPLPNISLNCYKKYQTWYSLVKSLSYSNHGPNNINVQVTNNPMNPIAT